MKTVAYYRRRQRSIVFVSLLLFQMVLILLQLWLFVSALEGILSREFTMALPGAIVSALCLAVNTWMLVGLNRADRDPMNR